MRDRQRDDGTPNGSTDLSLIRCEEIDGAVWGMIIHRGVVVRAPFPRFVGATTDQIVEWALYNQVAIKGLDTAALTLASSAAGSPACDAPSTSPSE